MDAKPLCEITNPKINLGKPLLNSKNVVMSILAIMALTLYIKFAIVEQSYDPRSHIVTVYDLTTSQVVFSVQFPDSISWNSTWSMDNKRVS